MNSMSRNTFYLTKYAVTACFANMNVLTFVFGTLLSTTHGIKFYDPEIDNSAEGEPALPTTTNAPVISDGDQLSSGDIITHGLDADDENLNKETTHFLSLELPENHKNASGPYASSIELPPVIQQFNAYQEQYKKYNKQKSEYGYKPIKFEADAAKNHYSAQGLGSYLEVGDKYEELEKNREPFPYKYESERIPYPGQPVWSEPYQIENEIGYNNYYHKPEENVSKDADKSLYGWKTALKFFTTLVPLGLLLASITPSIITLNSTDQGLVKQRSLTDRDFGELNRTRRSPECEKKLICELSRLGKSHSGTYIQKSFWILANETPEDLGERLGVSELLKRIRTGKCDEYKCQMKRQKILFTKNGKRKTTKV